MKQLSDLDVRGMLTDMLASRLKTLGVSQSAFVRGHGFGHRSIGV